MVIDPKKYGTATEVAVLVGVERRTLATAMDRRYAGLEVVQTVGGTLLVSLASARKYAADPPKRGPKPKNLKSR